MAEFAGGVSTLREEIPGPLRDFLSRAAELHAEHASARYRFDEHASFAGSTRAHAGSFIGGVCRGFAGESQSESPHAESSPRGSGKGSSAGRNPVSTKADIHASVAALAAREARHGS